MSDNTKFLIEDFEKIIQKYFFLYIIYNSNKTETRTQKFKKIIQLSTQQ